MKNLNENMKVFYFHVPKTAGSSVNKFFSDNMFPFIFHIEGFDLKSDIDLFDRYNFLSGHVSYTKINQLIDLNDWISIATFREPVAYAISHLKWVRKLADEGEEERFYSHPKVFQQIATKMLDFDFSQADEISRFISWLEKINFSYLHNTQTLYMNEQICGFDISDEQMDIAFKNMNKINFVGIQEEMDEFMSILRYEMTWDFKNNPRENINENNYGFDKNDPDTREALKPLYEKDLLLYEHAKEKFHSLKDRYFDINENTQTRGHLDVINSNLAKGWIRFKDNLNKVVVEVVSDDTVLDEIVANNFRQGLKSKNIHPSGCCAFEINFKKYSTDSDIYLRLKHNQNIMN